jgi:hypothetical protein
MINGVQATAYSARSYLAPASGSGRGAAFGVYPSSSFQLTSKWAKINGISSGLQTAQRRSATMIAIRGIYNGKTFSPLPGEPVSQVQRDMPVAIIFLEKVSLEANKRPHQVEVAGRMRTARDAMPISVDLRRQEVPPTTQPGYGFSGNRLIA